MQRLGMSELVVFLFVCSFSCLAAAYSGGTGSAEEPYQINSIADWQTLMSTSADWNDCFILTTDLDLSGVALNPVGNESVQFGGRFDGANHVIRNASVGLTEVYSDSALFGRCNGHICNLGVININVSGTQYCGGLIGHLNTGSVTSCFSTGLVHGHEAGGLVGRFIGGSISHCYSTCVVMGQMYAGGLIGRSPIREGGISFCYATGYVDANGSVGGILGAGNVEDQMANFFDRETTNTLFGNVGTPLTTAQMMTAETFIEAGWDLTLDWKMPCYGYPSLSWEKYSGGKGTENDPYQIATKEDLLAMGNATADYSLQFLLMADIDLSSRTPFSEAVIAPDTSLLIGFQGKAFTGTFDGNGHVIHNLSIDGSKQNYLGLFGYVSAGTLRSAGGQIRNLGLENVKVSGVSYVGGLVGKNHHGTIHRCYTTGNVAASGEFAGGLIGYHGPDSLTLWGSAVNDCYSKCSVTAYDTAGGLIGMNYQSAVLHSYSTGLISGKSNLGGFCGQAKTGGNFEDNGNFWDVSTSQITQSAMGTGLPTKYMQTATAYINAGWDFDGVWAICEKMNTPRIQWQIPAMDWLCPDGVSSEDLQYLLSYWLMEDCSGSEDCSRADVNHSGWVDLEDFAIFAQQWLQGIPD